MSRFFALLAVLALIAACQPQTNAQFWRPISEPNIRMPLDQAQMKLDYDLSQCGCGIFPRNVPQPVLSMLDQDKQRLNETSVVGDAEKGQCTRQPSLLVGECMRARGWEIANCSGRMPVAGGASVCAAYRF